MSAVAQMRSQNSTRYCGAVNLLLRQGSKTVWILVAVSTVYAFVLIASSHVTASFRPGALSISRDGREYATAEKGKHNGSRGPGRSYQNVRRTQATENAERTPNATMYLSTDCSCEAYESWSAPTPPRPTSGHTTSAGSLLQDRTAPQRVDTSSIEQPLSAEFLSETYVISLASRPDRRQYMCAILQRLAIPALIWPAVSADDDQVRSIHRQLAQQRRHQAQYLAGRPAHNDHGSVVHDPAAASPGATAAAQEHLRRRDEILTAGEIACYASHVSVWRDAAARDAAGPLLVLEDDADLDAGFVAALRGALARLPPDWDILWVGSCFEENQQAHSPQKVAHRLYRAKMPMCTHAYLLRGSAVAAMLLAHAGTITDPWAAADYAMVRAVRAGGMHAYAMLPPPVAQLPHDVPPPPPPQPPEPPQPPPAAQLSYNDRLAAKQQRRRQHDGGRVGTLAFPTPGAPRSNPSTVRERRSWLPLQRLVHPVRDLLLAEEEVRAGAGRGGAGAAWNRTCGIPLFALQPPPGTPPAAMAFGEAEYLP